MSQSRQETSNEAKKPQMTVMQSLITGSMAGAAEVLIDHPFWTLKTRKQRGYSLTFNPYLLYRGVLPNAASMVPITATQIGLDRCIQNLFFDKTKELSNTQRMTSAFVAGAGSALICCPTDMMMTYQGAVGGSFYAAGKYLVKQGGVSNLYTGLAANAMRDGMFTAFYLAVTPMLKGYFQPYFSKDSTATIASAVVAGVGAAMASQAVDTVKTIQQAADYSERASFKDTAKKLYSKEGVHGFFKGGAARGIRVVSAVNILTWVKEKMETKFGQQ